MNSMFHVTRTWAAPRVRGSSGEDDCLLSTAAESSGDKGRVKCLYAMKAADGKVVGFPRAHFSQGGPH